MYIVVIYTTGAFRSGWGASCQGVNTGGPWTAAEQVHHINFLELKAAFLALQTFRSERTGISVLLLLDNNIHKQMKGNHSYSLSDLTVEIWNWCIDCSIIIHAEHVPCRCSKHSNQLTTPEQLDGPVNSLKLTADMIDCDQLSR